MATVEAECLPGCEETHEPDCPALKQEALYWANYFGLRLTDAPEDREHNRKQLKAFAPAPYSDDECVRHDWDKHGLCLGCGANKYENGIDFEVDQ